MCSDLSTNALNGSVPSSVSALTKLSYLCVPLVTRCWHVWPRRVGSVGSAPSTRHVGGCMSGASSRGGAAAGPLRCSRRGPRARDVTKEYSRGTPILCGLVRGYGRGTWLLWVRRSTARAAESASGVQRPLQQRADGECAELALRAHQSFCPVCAPFLPTAFARAADVGRDRSALLRAARHVGGIE